MKVKRKDLVVVRGDLTISLIGPIIRYFDDKNCKNIFAIFFGRLSF